MTCDVLRPRCTPAAVLREGGGEADGAAAAWALLGARGEQGVAHEERAWVGVGLGLA